jgi:levanase/fructan beta-fructosidase
VLKNPGIKDFRDPKVFWDAKRKQWVMGLAAQDRQHFYASKNLKDWTFLSEFGKDIGGHGGVWECPDLFPIKVEGTNEEKWVLVVNINPGGPNGGSAAQYFVGDFDGTTFKMDDVFTKQLEKKKVVWLDWGRDNYASVSFDNVPDNKRVIIGWMSNWDYSPDVPTEKWRSSSTIPREVALKRTKKGYALTSIPVSQLKDYEGKMVKREIRLGSDKKLISKGEIDLAKAAIDIDLKKMTAGVYTFVLKNSLGERLSFGIDNNKQELFIDRTRSGKTDFKDNFADRISKAPLAKNYRNATFKILLDKTSLEIFFENGEKVMTEIFFPNKGFSELSVSTDSKGSILDMKAHQLNIN